ncbi:hypothetical protein EGM88_12670 [Aureibaculum marinum]|uniref:DUF6705 domain-containing protein n=1 Tax=Aureibaculum marinum TaxID=2487930 RepID=A0A3N4NPK3_9FLAO|nr:DUF6705 family protein [Aureibaculum marinum]RPD94040.1 hypothetical protein EGM88_12670 [Aureibaculum marinum]
MKKLLLIGLIILSTLNCKAQIIPIEEYIDYRDNEIEIPDGAYIKDVNNLLDKFIGTWEGTYNNKTYKFYITEITKSYLEISEDKLLIRYKITDTDGNVIENTTALPSDNTLVIKGRYLDKSKYTYVFYYQGKNSDCGQNGDVFISVYGTNNTKMKLFLQVSGEIWSGADCPDTPIAQILPTEQMELIKQ